VFMRAISSSSPTSTSAMMIVNGHAFFRIRGHVLPSFEEREESPQWPGGVQQARRRHGRRRPLAAAPAAALLPLSRPGRRVLLRRTLSHRASRATLGTPTARVRVAPAALPRRLI
jgi:hypothetical protein